jgi:hypothetical protein
MAQESRKGGSVNKTLKIAAFLVMTLMGLSLFATALGVLIMGLGSR